MGPSDSNRQVAVLTASEQIGSVVNKMEPNQRHLLARWFLRLQNQTLRCQTYEIRNQRVRRTQGRSSSSGLAPVQGRNLCVSLSGRADQLLEVEFRKAARHQAGAPQKRLEYRLAPNRNNASVLRPRLENKNLGSVQTVRRQETASCSSVVIIN